MPRRYLIHLGLSLILFVSPLAAVELILPDIDGQDRSLSEFRGKWVLVNFWATWCPPCIDEMPALELFHDAHKDRDAVVVGINMEDIGLAQLRAFVAEMFISYPILLAPADGATTLGRITGLPTSILISPGGEVVARRLGPVSVAQIEQLIQQARARTDRTLK